MDIAAMSTALSQANVASQASVLLASKVMDVAKQNSANLTELMQTTAVQEQSVNPNLGTHIDIRL